MRDTGERLTLRGKTISTISLNIHRPEYPPQIALHHTNKHHDYHHNLQLLVHHQPNHVMKLYHLAHLQKSDTSQYPQHAKTTPPSVTSIPEPNIRRKKQKLNDNSPWPASSTSSTTTQSSHYTISLFGPNPNLNMQAPAEADLLNPNLYTPVS